MSFAFRVVFCAFSVICIWCVDAQFEGQNCENQGENGVCKLITDCPKAVEDIRNRRMPQICSFQNADPVVCCVESSAPTRPPVTAPRPVATTPRPITTTSPPTTTTPRPVLTTSERPVQPAVTTTTEYVPPVYDYQELDDTGGCAPISANMTAQRTGEKAWDMCIEYQEQYVFPCEKSVALVGGMTRGSNCRHKTSQLIIGGENAAEAEFPHMALLGFENLDAIDFKCGGTIISERFILTAGHCTSISLGAVSHALVGTLRRSDDYRQDRLYRIKTIIKHPDYFPPSKYNDIALLETDRMIKMSALVIPACLDVGRDPLDVAEATGWGLTKHRGSTADVLQKVKLNKFDDLICKIKFPVHRNLKQGFDSTTQMCYGDFTKSKDTCQGDSGGPLQINAEKLNCMYVIVGVTSFGSQCGVKGEPGIYTKVKQYVPWIESVVWS